MKRICMYLLAAALLVCVGTASAQCPAFAHRANITRYIDSGYTLPVSGIVVSSFLTGAGLVTAPLGSLAAQLIPNTSGDGTCNNPAISEDGQWVLYYGNSKLHIIRIDGQFKTDVPVVSLGPGSGEAGNGPRFGVCTFWYNAPGSTPSNKKLEVAYMSSQSDIHAIPVTLSANAAPTFGADHLVAHFGGTMSFSFGIAANNLIARINMGGYDTPRMATIPATGNATDADIWTPSTQQVAGCMCTISHDGSIAGYNSAYANWCACLADQTCNFRHLSLTLVPFQEKTATPVAWSNVLVKTMAVSINWAPRKFFNFKVNANGTIDTLNGDAKTSDFGPTFENWSYTNNNDYIVGSLQMANFNITPDSLNKAIRAYVSDSGAVWLIHYPTNTWTRILRPLSPVAHNTLLAAPAVWIDPTSVGAITPLHGNRLEYRGVPSRGRYMFDIRGRRIESISAEAPKLTSGVYYSVDQNGIMKRVIVGR